MSTEAAGNNDRARHWLELKQAWTTWVAGRAMPDLSPAAQAYFEAIAFERFSALLNQSSFEHVPKVASPREAWAHVLNYLVTQRPKSRLYLLDDLFVRARNRAASFGVLAADDQVEQYIGWLLKQFQMRMREIVKDYVREFGTDSVIGGTTPLSAPVGGAGDETGRTLEDTLEGGSPDAAEAVAAGERAAIGPAAAAAFFPAIRAPFKLSIFLRTMRLRRCVTIACNHPTVLELAGLGHAVFADGARKTLEQDFPRRILESPECEALDRHASYQLCLQAMVALLDLAEEWMWRHVWLPEMAGHRAELAPPEFKDRAQAFVALLGESLRDAGDISSEKEIAALFQAIEDMS